MKKLISFLVMLLVAQATFNLSAQNLNEGFESETFPPEGWTVINKGDPNGWERTTSGNYIINGNGSASIRYGASAHNDWLITPRLIPTAENNTISFYAKNHSPVYKDLFHVKLSTTGNAEEDFSVVLAENIAAPTTATKYEYDLSAYNGQKVYVAVQAISTDKYSLILDDFVGPTIFSPALDAAIVSIENTTAYMGNYDIVVTLKNYGTTDLTACDINYSINGTPSTYNWTGTLAKNAHEQVTIVTDYDFTTPDDYIIEATVVLAGDEGLFNNTRVKTVAYYGLFSFPYFEGFEEGNVNGNAITGWSQQSLSGDESWTANTETTYNRTPRTGNWNAYLKNSNTDWMFTPKRVHLEVDKTYAFAMYARQTSSYNTTITVAYGTEPQNSAMVNTIVPSTNITNGNYQEITASFSPAETGVYHLGIKGDIGFSSYLLIDDISIRIAHTLNYAADANGTIAGETSQIVDPGANGTAVTAVANTGYHFVKWSDGSTDNPRTDVNVTENMSYTAEFAINTYTITIAAGENGEITPASEQTVAYGSNATFTITPNAGFFITSVLVDNVSVGLLTSYTFNNISENHSISATFSNVAPSTHAITATAGQNGSILPSGVVSVVENGDITFAISATNGYSIKDVLVDGVSVGNVSSYTFANATAAHTIEAEFTPVVNALHFDGTNDYVAFPTMPTSIDLSQGFGFAAWVKWDAFTDNARIMSAGNGSNSHSDDIVLHTEGSSSRLVAEIRKGSAGLSIRTDIDAITTNTWHHIALTINPMASNPNRDVTIYVDGVPVKNGILPTPNNVERKNVWLGKSHFTNDKYFKGSMDQVSFWNKALTKNDILNSMKTDIAGTETELFGYYKFNQGIKDGSNTSEISLSDSSTYNRNGELKNFALTGTTSNWVDGYSHSIQTLTVATIANGTLSAIPSEGIVTGSEIAITAIPDLGCTLTEGSIRAYKTGSTSTVVRINEDAEGNHSIIMPAFDLTLTAEFTINTYTLNYTAGANGSLTGDVTQTVNYNTNGTAVTAVANTGYHFVQWSDGKTANPRTDANVTENMSYTAEFAINTYTITIAAGENGEISPAAEQVAEHGSNLSFSITPNAGFYIASVLVDGQSVGIVSNYSFNNMADNHSISATFTDTEPTIHIVTASAGENGSISPSGEVLVVENEAITFNITANTGSLIKDVLVDGVSVGNVPSYTFENIAEAHTIVAEFAILNALHFDGANDYVSFPALPTSIDLSQGFGFAAWVKWDAFTGNARIMSAGNGSSSHSDDIVLRIEGSSKLVAEIIKDGVLAEIRTDLDVITTNTWYYIALTINPMASSSNSDVTIYVNGVPVKNGTLSTPNNVERKNVWLGKSHWTGDKYFKGSMDEVSFWNKALTKNEIVSVIKDELAGTETGLIGYYGFNQGIAAAVNTGETTLNDASSFNRNGTLNSFSLTGTTSNWVMGYESPVQFLTVSTVANGTITATPNEGIVVGSVISITTTPAAGYKLVTGSLRAYKTGNESVEISIDVDSEGNQTFVMPAYDVTLSASFSIATGFEDGNMQALQLYPNPAKDKVYIKGLTALSRVEVYNMTGEKVMAKTVEIDHSLNLHGLPNGVYLLKVEDMTFKLVINK